MHTFETTSGGRKIRINFLTPAIARVQVLPEGRDFKPSPLNRYQFIQEPDENPAVSETTQEGITTLSSSGFSIKIRQGGLISAEKEGRTLLEMDTVTFGEKKAIPLFNARPGEDWIGFGDQTRERLFHRGHTANCWVCNVTSYIPVPCFFSTEGYGVLVNTTCLITFDMCAADPEKFSWDDERGVLDFYLFAAPTFKELIRHYTLLTGKPKLPPEWSFGLWYICREHANDDEVMTDALNFRREEIPCDLIGLEPGWMEKFYDCSNDKKWHPERFPLPEWQNRQGYTFINALQRMGFHLELWLSQDYDLSFEEERRINGGELPKPENPKVVYHKNGEVDPHFAYPKYLDTITKRDIPWFDHLKKFVDWGADFFKQDGAFQVCTHPDRLFGNGMTDYEMHNLYPLLYSRQMWEGFAAYTNRRPVGFTVAGWTGFQAWGGTWTGDTGGRLDTLAAMLNTATLGHSWVTNDMEVTQKEGIHFGYLQPWSQINSWSYFRMPWYQGKELLEMHKAYARLRSRLIPYIYSWGRSSTLTGVPLMLPLHIEFQQDTVCRKILHEYLLGRDLLVSIYKHDVYLPEGRWKDFWNGKVFEGNQQIDHTWPENRGGSLFVREGGIISFGPVMQYRKERPLDEIEVYVFPSETPTSFELYEDDGVSFDYLLGKFTLTEITQKKTADAVEITIADTPDKRSWRITAALDAMPKAVENNGTLLPESAWKWNAERNELEIFSVTPGKVRII